MFTERVASDDSRIPTEVKPANLSVVRNLVDKISSALSDADAQDALSGECLSARILR